MPFKNRLVQGTVITAFLAAGGAPSAHAAANSDKASDVGVASSYLASHQARDEFSHFFSKVKITSGKHKWSDITLVVGQFAEEAGLPPPGEN